MMKHGQKVTLILFLLALVVAAAGQDARNYDRFASGAKGLHYLMATSPAYHQAVLGQILVEASQVARDLKLPEILPIRESNLTAIYIQPPRMAQRLGAIGNVTTANYTYYFSVSNRFSFLVRSGLEQDYVTLCRQYLWPIDRMDTNAAYLMATQWLAAVSMDVSALNKDCNVHIGAFTPEGAKGSHFVPIYWVYWTKAGQDGRGSVASVELFEPTKLLRQLRVEDARYILRKPLQIPNWESLLSQTNE